MPSVEPHYRRIMRELRARIAAGEFPPDKPLPTTAELAEAYGAGRSQVRMAIIIMIETGELRGHQGKAVYAVERVERPEGKA